ncbi:3-oxo-tetronate kinase [uncultured Pseudokineococcus sp.]|uniref:3-oxo-tetronate kinase n=1 Tax=uncultured Pseudokineococcus sp. TaxID=1642928 RepID=UPI00260980D0|nr:3-oxo-tetronate kinase [uncultured Pseudokineococcus sp.]
MSVGADGRRVPLRGAVADDFTGATDLAGSWRARGLRTAVVLGVPDETVAAGLDEQDAVVVALRTRSAPVDEAVAASRAAAEVLVGLGVEQVYDKYCSTFDSSPEGNIGPVADALLEVTGAPGAVVVPAFPAAGRTVYQGHLFVHDQLLHDSPMRDHPLNPMWDSRLAVLLGAQTAHAVACVPLGDVRAGAEHLRRELDRRRDAGARYLVVDSLTDDDLAVVARATASDRLVTGGSGLALGTPPTGRRLPPVVGPPGRRAVLAGSASAATRRQVAAARGRLASRGLDVAALADGPDAVDAVVDDLVAWARAEWAERPEQPVLVFSVADASDVRRGREASPDASALVEACLGRLAPALVDAGASQLVVAGGETSGAVLHSLGVRRLEIGQPLGPGLSWSAGTTPDGRPLALVLKSGNFGADDLFTAAWQELG